MDGKISGLGTGGRVLLLGCLLAALGGCNKKENDPPDTVQPPPGQTMTPVMGGPAAPPSTPPPTGAGQQPPAVTPPAAPPGSGDVPTPPAGAAGSMAPPVTEPMAGAGAEDPMEPTEPTEPPAMEPPPPRMDLGKGDGKDVITIGDSWMTLYGGGIQGGLDRLPTRYRHFGVAGTTLIGGDIPQQWERSGKMASTVIMTGGGNDIMFSGGCNTTEACEMSVARIQTALGELWTKMADEGVKDVIYVQYSKDAGTAPQGTRPTTPPPPIPICLSGRINCYSLATTDLVMGDLPDGIHPSGTAHDRIAKALMELMEKNGVRR
ncbi:MAG TPA: SGNH/GDSL hydrolase family protein [Polyangiales bacterium]|nr:SGNH/GDSL hydrolase family protein [Polyangiales bacterium]